MKTINSFLLLFSFLLVSFCSCKKEEVPTLTTSEITNITPTSASSGGDITDEGSGTVIDRGVCWSTDITPTTNDYKTADGAGAGEYESSLINLKRGTTYYVRAYATNKFGTGYGMALSFQTLSTVPVVATINSSGITKTSAMSGGEISSDGGFPIIERGVCWGERENPTLANNHTNDGTGSGLFNTNLTGLIENRKYYVRAFATNNIGTGYGNQISFTTQGCLGCETGSVSDIDGNNYKTLKIGYQWWMGENLRTTKYNDGSNVPYITSNSEWSVSNTGAFCWFNNDPSNKPIYGALYNWYAVNRGNLCPVGWRIPTSTEWNTLTEYLGGTSIAGGKMKEVGNEHWSSPNSDATNESGFHARGASLRDERGVFGNLKQYAYFWSSTETNSTTSLNWKLFNDNSNAGWGSNHKLDGFSVRCIKN